MFKYFRFLICLLIFGVFATITVDYVVNLINENGGLPKELIIFKKNDHVEEATNIIDRYTIDISNGLSLSENLKQGFQFFNANFIDNLSDEDIISIEDLGDVLSKKLYEYGLSSDEIQKFLDDNLSKLKGYSKYVSIVFDDMSNNMNVSQGKISFYIIRRDEK